MVDMQLEFGCQFFSSSTTTKRFIQTKERLNPFDPNKQIHVNRKKSLGSVLWKYINSLFFTSRMSPRGHFEIFMPCKGDTLHRWGAILGSQESSKDWHLQHVQSTHCLQIISILTYFARKLYNLSINIKSDVIPQFMHIASIDKLLMCFLCKPLKLHIYILWDPHPYTYRGQISHERLSTCVLV